MSTKTATRIAKESPRRAARRRTMGIAATIATISAVAVAIYSTRERIPRPTDSPVEVTRFVSTDQFVRLPAAQKQAYVERLERLTFDERRSVSVAAKLTKEQALAAYRNVFRQAAQHRIDTYFSITDEKQRQVYLDHLIDEFEHEQSFRKHEPPDPSQIKAQLESMPPGQRAQAAEFLRAFVQRRIVRGLGLFQ